MIYQSMRSYRNGFTLTEIIIAIALVVIFVTLPSLSYANFLKKSRDTQRRTDLNNIHTALEMYKTANGVYPEELDELLEPPGYLNEVPKDPKDGQETSDGSGKQYGYEYESEDGRSFILYAPLEDEEGGGTEKSYYVVTPLGGQSIAQFPSPTIFLPTSTLFPTRATGITGTVTPTAGMSTTPTGATVTANPSVSPSVSVTGTVDLAALDITTENGYYKVYYCNQGTGTSTAQFRISIRNNTNGQEYESPVQQQYAVPPAGSCAWSGGFTCELVNASCATPASIQMSVDTRNVVGETNEVNNSFTKVF